MCRSNEVRFVVCRLALFGDGAAFSVLPADVVFALSNPLEEISGDSAPKVGNTTLAASPIVIWSLGQGD